MLVVRILVQLLVASGREDLKSKGGRDTVSDSRDASHETKEICVCLFNFLLFIYNIIFSKYCFFIFSKYYFFSVVFGVVGGATAIPIVMTPVMKMKVATIPKVGGQCRRQSLYSGYLTVIRIYAKILFTADGKLVLNPVLGTFSLFRIDL